MTTTASTPTTGQFQVPTNSATGFGFTNSQTKEISYKFTPSGTWKPKADIPDCTPAGLKGFAPEIQTPLSEALKPFQENLKYPNNTTFALLAVNKTTRQVIEVSKETTVVLKPGETLTFVVNDFTPNYEDNTGTLTVKWSAPIGGNMTKGIFNAALNGQGKYAGKAYFFKGHVYVRYDWNQDKVDDGYPLALSGWNLPGNFASGIDAALNGLGKYAGKAYFFKGDQYVRYDWNQDKVDAGYPLALSGWNLPGDFASGIDAALNGLGKYAGKAYFFKGDQYVRYDWNQDKVDAGYPLALSGWNLPGDFASGIDTALDGQGQYAGKAYFFKGDQYVRYDWNQDKVDGGYPRPIVNGWQGITELFVLS
jgi:hypothetical protein